ncbi:RNA polymerase sigma factor [Nannocystaceae bacterium ST9]
MADDADLEQLEKWRAGDQRAGAALYRKYFASVRSYFINRVPEAQEDLIQETFLGLTKAKDQFRGDSTFKTYLFRIARYVYTGHLRKHCRPDREINPASDSIADLGQRRLSSVLVERENLRLLLDALRAVSLDDQDLLELYYFEGLSGEQLAELFTIPLGTVRSRIHAAKQRLTKCYAALANQPHDLEWTDDEFADWMAEVAQNVRRGQLRPQDADPPNTDPPNTDDEPPTETD